MMTARVLLFAGLREIAQTPMLNLSIDEPYSIGHLRHEILHQYPAMTSLLSRCRIAVNQTFVPDDHILHEGDEIAVIPPVSGG